jgi:TonB family protein
VTPKFSDEAQRAKYSGICILSLVVDKDGSPRDIRVVRRLGMGLDEKAIEAVNQYRFKPAMKDGEPVPVRITVEVNFRLF